MILLIEASRSTKPILMIRKILLIRTVLTIGWAIAVRVVMKSFR